MKSETLHHRLESLRAQLLARVQETGDLGDELALEISQRLDLLIVIAQKMKRDKLKQKKRIRTIA